MVLLPVVVLCALAIPMVASKPTPPALAQQFTTNFTIRDSEFDINATNVFKGFTAIDYKNGGGLLTIGGEEFVPFYFHTNFIAYPNKTTGTIEGYMFEGPLCWDGGQVDKNFLVMWPLHIPKSATFEGNQTITGVECMVWQWPVSAFDKDATFKMWVAYDNSALLKWVISDPDYSDTIVFTFTDTKVGPINPDYYQPPSIDCPAPPFAARAMKSPSRFLQQALGAVGKLHAMSLV